ncbi:death domain-associated protein 6 [Trichonephila clavipes]|uniref:Death domain-associated protein 6 n=1 Tax=Trichonephila clavipes TaxID=2585209 RepID=A0A8X6S684_TRICX|nr:death domain-associated protein 6 [Trichonephila clavipes]
MSVPRIVFKKLLEHVGNSRASVIGWVFVKKSVKNSLNKKIEVTVKKTDANGKKTARKSTQSKMGLLTSTLKQKSEAPSSSQSYASNSNKADSNASMMGAIRTGTLSDILPMAKKLSSSNKRSILKSNASVPTLVNRSKEDVASISEKNTLSATKDLPHITITPVSKSSTHSNLNSKPFQTARKSFSSRFVSKLPLDIQVDSTESAKTLNKEVILQPVNGPANSLCRTSKKDNSNFPAKEETISSELVNQILSGIQITSMKSNISSNSPQQPANIISDSNKSATIVKEKIEMQTVHSSTSSSCKLPQNKCSNGNNSVTTGNVNKKARKSFPTPNVNIPVSLLSSLGKSGISISNVSASNPIKTHESISEDKKRENINRNMSTKLLNKTIPGVSITEVKSKKPSVTELISNKSGPIHNKFIQSSADKGDAKINKNLLKSYKEQMPKTIFVGSSNKKSIFSKNSIPDKRSEIAIKKLQNRKVSIIPQNRVYLGNITKISASNKSTHSAGNTALGKAPVFVDVNQSKLSNKPILKLNSSNKPLGLPSTHVLKMKLASKLEESSSIIKNQKPSGVLNPTACESKKNIVPKSTDTSSKSTNFLSQKPSISIFPVSSKGISIKKNPGKLKINSTPLSTLPVSSKGISILKPSVKHKVNITRTSTGPSKKVCSQSKPGDTLFQNSDIEETQRRIVAIKKSLENSSSQPTIKTMWSSNNITQDKPKSEENFTIKKSSIIPLPYVTKTTEEGARQIEELDKSQERSSKSEEMIKTSHKEVIEENEKLAVPAEKPQKQVTSPKLSLKRKTDTENSSGKRLRVELNVDSAKVSSLLNAQNNHVPISTKANKVTVEEPWHYKDDNSVKLAKFLQFCRPLMNCSLNEEEKIIKILMKHFERAEPMYVKSKEFISLLVKIIKAKPSNSNVFVHLETIKNELKAHNRKDHFSSGSSDKSEASKKIPNTGFSNNEHEKLSSAGEKNEDISSNLLNQNDGKENVTVAEMNIGVKSKKLSFPDEKNEDISFNSCEQYYSKKNVTTTYRYISEKSEKFSITDEKNEGISPNSHNQYDFEESVTPTNTYINEKTDENKSGYLSNRLISEPSEFSDAEDRESSPSLLSTIQNESSENKKAFLNNFYLGPSTSKQADEVELKLLKRSGTERLSEMESKKKCRTTLTKIGSKNYHEILLETENEKNLETSLTETERKSYHSSSFAGFHNDSFVNHKKIPLSRNDTEKNLSLNSLDSYLGKSHTENEINSNSNMPSVEKQINSDSTESGNKEKDVSTSETNVQYERRIKRLENFLGKLDRKIQRLQQKELSFDDLDDEDSIYIQESRLKKKFNDIWVKLCSYKKCSSLIGRKMERRFTYEGSRYRSINYAVERLVNKRKSTEKFPNYVEILETVRKKNEEDNLGIADGEDEQIEEFSTVIQDDDTNINNEKELSLEQKLELAITKKISSNQYTVQKAAISKTIQREINLFEDEGNRAATTFKDIGRALKLRRQKDVYHDIYDMIPDDEEFNDPADQDENLRVKLSNHQAECEKKLDELVEKYAKKQRDEENENPQKVLEVENSTESEHSDIPDTEPATPSTDERIVDSEPEKEVSKPVEFEQKENKDNPEDVIEIGSSSDASTEPGCGANESRKSANRPNLLTETPLFINDDIEVIDSSDSPDLPEL